MSTKKQRELWLAYVYNQRQFLENDVKQLQQNIRFRRFDSVDCLELIIATERLAFFNEFVKHTDEIFKIITADDLEKK